MSDMITITDRKCPLCGTAIGKITASLSITYYCRNVNCWYFGEPEMTDLVKRLLA